MPEPELFVRGHFADMLAAGVEPFGPQPFTGGLPQLPEGASMEIETCFVAAARNVDPGAFPKASERVSARP